MQVEERKDSSNTDLDQKTEKSILDRGRTLILRNSPGTQRFRQEHGPKELPSE